MSYVFNCPTCSKKLFQAEGRERKYGKMIYECKHCGAKYIDPRYHEIALNGMPQDEFSYIPYIFMIAIGALILWRGGSLLNMKQLGIPDEMQFFLPVVFIILGLVFMIGGLYEIIRIKTGLKYKKFKRLYNESLRRLKEPGYLSELYRLGYEIDEDTKNRILNSVELEV